MKRKYCQMCKKGIICFMTRWDKDDKPIYICESCARECERQGYLVVSYHRK